MIHYLIVNNLLTFSRFSLGPLECESQLETLNDESVTFFLQEGAIEINIEELEEVKLSWDVYFEFKSGLEGFSGTIFHALSPFDDLRITIENGSLIYVQYNDYQIEAVTALDDNNWHSLQLEINVKEMSLYIDKNSTVVTKGIVAYRSLKVAKAFIGALEDFTEGYVGCFRSLWINGHKINLSQEIAKLYPKGIYGVTFGGCIGACDTEPCKHDGLCMEEYEKFSCDCQTTAFRFVYISQFSRVN